MVKWTIFFVLIMTLLNLGDTLKILVIFPMPGRSHAILGDGIVNHLLAAGHEITYITAIPIKNPPPKLHQVDVSDNFEKVKGGADIMNIKNIMQSNINFNNPAIGLLFMGKIHTDTLENENVQNLLNDSTQNFDLILAEWMYSDLYAGLTAIYDCPLIWFSSMQPHWMILSLIDEHPNPSYTPDCISLNLPPFTMYQRFRELFILVLGTAVRDLYRQKVKELSSLYHDRSMPPGKELVYWVEYVVRTRGAVHLRSPALYTPFYQRMYLDLVAYTLIFLYIIKFLIKAYLLGGKVNKKFKTQ